MALSPKRARFLNIGLVIVFVALAAATYRVEALQTGYRWPTRNVSWTWGPGHDGSHETTARNAMNDWNNMTRLSLRESNGANFTLESNNFGATGWAGLASLFYRDPNVITQCKAQLNKHYDKSAAGAIFLFDGPYRRAVWCQEIGHCLGMYWHEHGSCMGVGYYLRTPSGGYAYSNSWTPDRNDADTINNLHQ